MRTELCYNSTTRRGRTTVYPAQRDPMLDMIALVREYQSGHEPPIVVHCR